MYYFAYGSNMNPQRMQERGIDFTLRFPARLLGYRLVFNKVAARQPAGVGYANIIVDPRSQVEGALYCVTADASAKLDACEGYPSHYARAVCSPIMSDGETVSAYTYVARPSKTQLGLRPTAQYIAHLLAARDVLSPAYYKTVSLTPTFKGKASHKKRTRVLAFPQRARLTPQSAKRRQRKSPSHPLPQAVGR